MNHIRALVHARSGLHRLLLTFTTALLLIAGLLAMHTLTGTLSGGHADTTATAFESAHVDVGTDVSAVTATETTPGMKSEAAVGHCAGDCGGSGGVPDHSMLTMVCALALLAAAIVLLAPVLLARLGVALALLRLHGRSVLAALPHPRPPSLLVLSISRT
ncbi:MAG: hypothetical protein DI566_08100 [Microbacterium sp.]|nr:MAG: hypothetical protein DI566_08100 [Microbacterium sp.]